MKKSVLIFIGIIYIVSIVIINFFGMKVSVYNQKIDVERIECLNKPMADKNILVSQNNTGKTLITIVYDKPANKNTMEGTMLQLNVRAYPDNATNKKLTYSVSNSENIELFTDENGDQTGLILFYGPTKFIDVVIRTTDNSNISLTLKVKAIAQT